MQRVDAKIYLFAAPCVQPAGDMDHVSDLCLIYCPRDRDCRDIRWSYSAKQSDLFINNVVAAAENF
jgi:hypothetical protein